MSPQLLELKNGETYNGHMVACDSWMNVHLREVICTSKASACNIGDAIVTSLQSHLRAAPTLKCCVQDGDRFWRMPETYVRGNTIKYLRVPNEVSRQRSFMPKASPPSRSPSCVMML